MPGGLDHDAGQRETTATQSNTYMPTLCECLRREWPCWPVWLEGQELLDGLTLETGQTAHCSPGNINHR